MITATKTLQEMYTDADGFSAAFPDIDTPTAQALFRAFYWRTVCDDNMFAPYLISFWDKNRQQYYDDLRIQLTRIDPVVTKYLEREITRGGSDSVKSNGKTTYNSGNRTEYGAIDTLTHGLTQETKHDTKDATVYGHTIDQTGSSSDDTTYGHTIKTSGTDNRSTKINQTQDVKTTDTTATRNTESTGKSNGYTKSDNRALAASLPRTDSYNSEAFPAPFQGGGSSEMGGADGISGMELKGMDWRAADSQTENVGANATAGVTSGTSKVTVDGNDISDTTTSYTGNADTDNLERDMTDTHGGSDTVEHTRSLKDTHGGTDTVNRTGTDTQKNSGDDVTKKTGADTLSHTGDDSQEGSQTTSYNSYNRERYTGHDGSPAELLRAARDFVRGTGAFERLCNRFDQLFICIYDDI